MRSRKLRSLWETNGYRLAERRDRAAEGHIHADNDELFFVLEGTPHILVGKEWVSLERGAFVLIPRGTLRDFRNTSDADAGLLNFFAPGGFERKMPTIVQWFAENR